MKPNSNSGSMLLLLFFLRVYIDTHKENMILKYWYGLALVIIEC